MTSGISRHGEPQLFTGYCSGLEGGGSALPITVQDLTVAGLDEQFAAIEDAVERYLAGDLSNVAVVSQPFAGREVFLDYAEEEFGAATGRVTFEEVVTGELPEFPVAEIVLVDNCHYLYTREIGGFDVLERFLDRVATLDAMYVTSWNRYAWAYLSAVSNVDDAFPETIEIPRLDAAGVRDLIASYHGTPLPMFVEADEGGRMKTVDLAWESLPLWGDRELPVPRPELQPEYVLSGLRSESDPGIEAAVYRRIARLSEGDPGVAVTIWEQSVRDGKIAPSYVQEVDQPLEIDDDEAFVLEVILTNERIAREQIERICTDIPVEQALGTLLAQGVITIDDGRVGVAPERLYSTVEHLARRQLVW